MSWNPAWVHPVKQNTGTLYLSTSPFIIKNLGALSCMSLPEDDPESSGDECLAIIFRALNQQKPPGGRILPQALLEKDLVRITSALCTVTLPSHRFLRCSQQRHPLQTYFPSYYTLIVGPCCQLALSANWTDSRKQQMHVKLWKLLQFVTHLCPSHSIIHKNSLWFNELL